MKFYEFVFSKLLSFFLNFVVIKNVFLLGCVYFKCIIMIKCDIVIVMIWVELGDFESFLVDEKGRLILWSFLYDEIIVVDKRIGMVDRGDMFVFVYFLISFDFILGCKCKFIYGLEVFF